MTPRRPLLVNLTWAVALLLGLALVYVLSYAPLVRLKFVDRHHQPGPIHDADLTIPNLAVTRPADSGLRPG